MKEVFSEDYARIYDELYRLKDYRTEADFIIKYLDRFGPSVRTILDLGCGTGNHDNFFHLAGYDVTGVDRSQAMIESARNKFPACTFLCSGIADLSLNSKFDAILSLFHVLSYQVEDSEVRSFFRTVKNHMHDESVAIIDYWNASAVLKEPLKTTRKEILHNGARFIRTATSEKIQDKPAYRIHIEVAGPENSKFSENHSMRFFSAEELRKFASEAGLNVVHTGAWLETDKLPDENSWSAFIVLKALR